MFFHWKHMGNAPEVPSADSLTPKSLELQNLMDTLMQNRKVEERTIDKEVRREVPNDRDRTVPEGRRRHCTADSMPDRGSARSRNAFIHMKVLVEITKRGLANGVTNVSSSTYRLTSRGK